MILHAACRAGLALLSAALLAGPAQASEVVNLARLVVSGTRSAGDAGGKTARIQRLPPVLIEGRRSVDGVTLAVQRRGLPKAL